MEINKMIARYNDLRETCEYWDSEYIYECHKNCVFRMNWYMTNIEIIEDQYKRIGQPIPDDHYTYLMYQRLFNE